MNRYFESDSIVYSDFDYTSTVNDTINKYLDRKPKKVVQGKADFKAFLEYMEERDLLKNFPSPSDFIKNQYRKVLASILWEYRKSILRTYHTTLRYRIGKEFTSLKMYTGKSRLLPLSFSYRTSKDFPSFWLDTVNEWDTSEESFLESEERFSNHLNYLSSSLNTSLLNESMDFSSLLILSDASEEIEEKKKRVKRQENLTSKYPVNDSTGNLIGFSVIVKNNDSLIDHYFQSV